MENIAKYENKEFEKKFDEIIDLIEPLMVEIAKKNKQEINITEHISEIKTAVVDCKREFYTSYILPITEMILSLNSIIAGFTSVYEIKQKLINL